VIGSVRLYRGADYAETAASIWGDDADNVRIDPEQACLGRYGAGAIATVDPATRSKMPIFRSGSSGGIPA